MKGKCFLCGKYGHRADAHTKQEDRLTREDKSDNETDESEGNASDMETDPEEIHTR